MKKLEKLRLILPDTRDAERLDRWLFEWNLLKELEVSNIDGGDSNKCDYCMGRADDCGGDEIRQIEECVAATDCEIEAGQIRLMTPQSGEEPVYIAVASVEPDGIAVCVPFGILAEPATDDELLSGRESVVVRVWCLWNRRRVPADIVRESWVADRLNADEMQRLLLAVAACDAGEPLPPDLRQDSGPPLIHPLDPRREYRRWERERIDQGFGSGIESKGNIINYDISAEPQQFLKAAEPPDDYEA
jgi:hypothetical protein